MLFRNLILSTSLATSRLLAQGGLPPPPPPPVLKLPSTATPVPRATPSPAGLPARPAATPFKGFGAATPVPAKATPVPMKKEEPTEIVEVETEQHAPPNMLTDDEKAGGWKLLFDGEKASGLRGLQKPDFLNAGWKVDKGALRLAKSVATTGKQTGGDLITTEAFDNFEFAFEFQLSASSDSGVLYFTRAATGQKPVGAEFQIVDDNASREAMLLGDTARSGGLHGILAPSELRVKMPRDLSDEFPWNRGRILVQGNHVEHWLNGERVVSYDLATPALAAAMKATKGKIPPGFGTKIKSVLALLDQGEEIAFRSLKVRLVPATPPATPVPPAITQPAPTIPAPTTPGTAQMAPTTPPATALQPTTLQPTTLQPTTLQPTTLPPTAPKPPATPSPIAKSNGLPPPPPPPTLK